MAVDIKWCNSCYARDNTEEANLEKGEELSFFKSMPLGGLNQCTSCGVCFEQWKEEGIDGLREYRNRLTLIETLYALQESNKPKALQFYKRLSEELDTLMLDLHSQTVDSGQSHLEWIQLNLIQYYHAKGDKEAIANLRPFISSGISMAVQCHLLDPPLLALV